MKVLYYRTLDGSAYGWDVGFETVPKGVEEISKEEYEALVTEQKAQAKEGEAWEAASKEPSQAERLRSDVDYIAAMTGVSL